MVFCSCGCRSRFVGLVVRISRTLQRIDRESMDAFRSWPGPAWLLAQCDRQVVSAVFEGKASEQVCFGSQLHAETEECNRPSRHDFYDEPKPERRAWHNEFPWKRYWQEIFPLSLLRRES